MAETIVVVNQGFTTRTSSTGRTRTTIDVSSEPLVHDLDPKRLGQGVAEAIARVIKERVASISVQAAPSTIASRKRKQKNVDMNRYAGGRIGLMPPGRSDKLFNDSGRLIESIVARPSEDQYIINVASNRFSTSTLYGGKLKTPMAALDFITERFLELVPEVRDPALLMRSKLVRDAIDDGTAGMIKRGAARIKELELARARAMFSIVRQVASVAAL